MKTCTKTGDRFPNVYGKSDFDEINNDKTFTYKDALIQLEKKGARFSTLGELIDDAGTESGQGCESEYLWTRSKAGHNKKMGSKMGSTELFRL